MADFHTDIQSIRHLVHTSESREAARTRFNDMSGFSLDRDTAHRVLNDTLEKVFPFKTETKASLLEQLSRKYGE